MNIIEFLRDKISRRLKDRRDWMQGEETRHPWVKGKRVPLYFKSKGMESAYDEVLNFLNEIQDNMGEVSDGYHTFNELYYYRMLYNAAFFNRLPKRSVHKSKRHYTGEECFGGGWFVVMAELPTGQVSNHYELKYWDLFKIPEREVAAPWDGHTPQEAAERLYKYLLES